MFVDYAGKKPTIVDAATGEVFAVELFVAALGLKSGVVVPSCTSTSTPA